MHDALVVPAAAIPKTAHFQGILRVLEGQHVKTGWALAAVDKGYG